MGISSVDGTESEIDVESDKSATEGEIVTGISLCLDRSKHNLEYSGSCSISILSSSGRIGAIGSDDGIV